MKAIGLDFGTTNTVMASSKAGKSEAFLFDYKGERDSAFRSALAFWQEDPGLGKPLFSDAGPWAIEQFTTFPGDTRFLQSFKSFAASPFFQHTTILSKKYPFEDLLATFFKHYTTHLHEKVALPKSLILGRPVRFAGYAPEEKLALHRYDLAFRSAGFKEIHYVYEPMAAAFFYIQRLEKDATILVADFGGGTSDFSIVRFERKGSGFTTIPLGHAGVPIAGDMFDYRIIDRVISPALGKDSYYKSWDKTLPMPISYYRHFAHWHELCLMNNQKILRELDELEKLSLEPDKIRAFSDLIRANVGFDLYQNVSRVKRTLSGQDKARLQIDLGKISLDVEIKRGQFETWISEDLGQIAGCVDQLLAHHQLLPQAIDRVFLTGGSSFIPAIRRLFEEKFVDSKIETGDQLVSIAKGLALIGEEENIEPWIVH